MRAMREANFPRISIVAILLLAGCARQTLTTEDVGSTILALEQQRQQAQLHGDWQTIQRLNAPDFTEIGGTGLTRTAAQNAQDMQAGRTKFQSVDYTDQEVRVFDDFAIVTGTAHRVGSFDGRPFDQHFRYSRTYARRNGEWRVVFAQNTPMP